MEASGTRPLVVLLVENNARHARIIRRRLATAAGDSLHVEHVDNPVAALQRVAAGGVDVLLLDVALPEVSDVVSKVIESGSLVPVVVLSRRSDAKAAARVIREGAEEYVVKSESSGQSLLRSIWMAIERKKLQVKLENNAARLARHNRQLKDFTHMLAHEVKSPLITVAACLGILEEKYGDHFDAETRGFVGDSQTAINSVSDLVHNLLELVRLGTNVEEFAEVNLEAVFYQAYAGLRAMIKETTATISHDPLPMIYADELQMRLLLQNLIGNAIKYRGNQPPSVHVGMNESTREWILSVRDNGVGIDPKDHQRIFEMFVRLDKALQVPGTGIGLTLCKLIVDNHQGRIWLESQPDCGTTFWVAIPKQLSNKGPKVSDEDIYATGARR